jgi:hypothetical protein
MIKVTQEREFAVVFRFGGKQALHNDLIGAVASHCEESAANQAGPERI